MNCTTHHNACDCREAKFEQLEKEHALLRCNGTGDGMQYSNEPGIKFPYKVITWGPYDWTMGPYSPIIRDVTYAPTLAMAQNHAQYVKSKIYKRFLGLYILPIKTVRHAL
jgi:hypothetical protein